MLTSRKQACADAEAACSEGPALARILQHACRYATFDEIYDYLLTSKSFRATVLAFCRGVVPVQHTTAMTPAEAQSFISWVAKHGKLISYLEFSTPLNHSTGKSWLGAVDKSAIEQSLAAALQHAATPRSDPSVVSPAECGLYISACKLRNATADIAAVLRQLPGQTLTSLELHLHQPDDSPEQPGSCIARLNSSLSHLTNLRSLELDFSSQQYHLAGLDPMMQQLSGLTRLTELTVKEVNSDAALQHLPASLKELQFSWAIEADRETLRLTHLTALTRLDTDEHVIINGNYALPSSLVHVYVADIRGPSALLPLHKLETLVMQSCDGHIENSLRQLSTLTSLKHIALNYHDGITSPQTVIDAWDVLPIKTLTLGDQMPSEIAQALGQLQQLVQLGLTSCCSFKCSANVLADSLQKLKQLELFHLIQPVPTQMPLFAVNPEPSETDEDLIKVFKALAYLPRLQQILFYAVPISLATAECIGACVARQLTKLALNRCDLDVEKLTAVLRGAVGLVELDIGGNPFLECGGSVVSALRGLPYLAKLRMSGVSPKGVRALWSARLPLASG